MRPYEKYGISPQLVERIKKKMKEPAVSEQVRNILDGVTKADLQDKAKVKKFLSRISQATGEKLTDAQMEGYAQFIMAQKIDPNNTLHLIKLWGMFR